MLKSLMEKLTEIQNMKEDREVKTNVGKYGTEYQGDDDDEDEDGEPKKKAAPAGEKRGRGRPRNDADNTGHVAKHEVDKKMPAWLKGGDAPKGKPDKKAVKKHSLKDWFEHMDAKMLAETEQLDELSPQTLGSYASKAQGQASWAKGVATRVPGYSDTRLNPRKIQPGSEADKYNKFGDKRLAGAALARKKGATDTEPENYDSLKKGGYGSSNPAIAEEAKSPFKKPNNPNRTPMDSARALAQKGMAAAIVKPSKKIAEAEVDEAFPDASGAETLSYAEYKKRMEKLSDRQLKYDQARHEREYGPDTGERGPLNPANLPRHFRLQAKILRDRAKAKAKMKLKPKPGEKIAETGDYTTATMPGAVAIKNAAGETVGTARDQAAAAVQMSALKKGDFTLGNPEEMKEGGLDNIPRPGEPRNVFYLVGRGADHPEHGGTIDLYDLVYNGKILKTYNHFQSGMRQLRRMKAQGKPVSMSDNDGSLAEGWKQTLRKFDPTIKGRILKKSQDQVDQGIDTIDQLTGMGLTSDDMVSRAMKPNTYFKNAERYADLANKGVAEGSGSSSPTRVMKKYLPKGMWDSILSHSGKSKHDNADGSKTSNVWRLRNLTRSWQGQEFDAWKKAVEQELGNGYKVTSEWPTPSVRHIQMNDISAQQGMAEGGGVDKKAMLNKLLSTHKYEKVLAITKQEDPQLYSSLKSVLGNADKHWRILNKATQKMNTIPLQDNKTLDHLEAVARDNQDMAEFYVHRAMKLLNGSAENNMAEADQPPTDSLMSPMSEARAKADEKKKCPPMSHIKKMCQDGKTVAEICKMHPDCNQKELKQMVADCKNKLEEGAKPDFLDLDKDGNKKEPMTKAAKDKKKTVKEGQTKVVIKGFSAWKAKAEECNFTIKKVGAGEWRAINPKTGSVRGSFSNKEDPGPGSLWGNSKPGTPAMHGNLYLEEGAKPDFLDLDKDGNKKEPMKKAAADKGGKKKTVKEGVEHNHQAARSEGKAHGLRGHSHCGNNYEDMEEARCYHEGFKEGLDEKHGHQYLDEEIPMVAGPGSMVDEEESLNYECSEDFYMEVIQGLIDNNRRNMSPSRKSRVEAYVKKEVTKEGCIFDPQRFEEMYQQIVDFSREIDEAMNDNSSFFNEDERSPIGGLQAPFSSPVDEMMNTIAFESLDRQLNALLDEGMTVSISKGQQGSPDSVSVTASDADSDKLLALVKQAGLGLFGGDEATMQPGATGSNMPSQSAPGSDIAVVDDHDDMMSLIKKVTDGHDDHGHEAGEETCESCGGMMEEGHSCREAVDEEETNPSDNNVAQAGAQQSEEDAALGQAAGQNFADTDEDLEESLANGADDTFESDIDFMINGITGGLNGKKRNVAGNGQSTIPAVAIAHESRLGNPMRESTDLLKDWKKLAGM